MSMLDKALADMDGETVEETPPAEEAAPVEAEAPAEAETAEPDTTPAGPEDLSDEQIEEGKHLFAGKYTSPEELERAYEELQSRMGEQGSELGNLRRLVEERLPEQQEPGLEINQPVVDWFDEQIETNPQGAAVWALQNDASGTLYERAMDNWYETPGQARRAAAFERALEAQRIEAQIADQTKPLLAQAEQQSIAAAWTQASAEIPDLATYAEQIVAEAKESPEILRGTQSLEDKTKAIHKLYRLVKGGQATSVESATAENAQTEAEAARAAKLDGKAASQTRAVTPETVSADEQWAREHLDKHLARYSTPE